MRHQCPVCGYSNLEEPPADYSICPCCGVEFGNDDFEVTHEVLRHRWLDSGAHWFSSYTPQPADWNPYLQLLRGGLVHDLSASGGAELRNFSLEGLQVITAERTSVAAGRSEVAVLQAA